MEPSRSFMEEAEALAYMAEHHCPDTIERDGGEDANLIRTGVVWTILDATDRRPKSKPRPLTPAESIAEATAAAVGS